VKAALYAYFHNLFLAVDQLANTIIGGDPDETFSSRIGKCQRGDHGRRVQLAAIPLAFIINVVFWWQGWGHCRNCIEDDEGPGDLMFKTNEKGTRNG